MYNKLVAELVMGRVCMGRVGYGPSLSWAEFVMGRDVQLPLGAVNPHRGLYRHFLRFYGCVDPLL